MGDLHLRLFVSVFGRYEVRVIFGILLKVGGSLQTNAQANASEETLPSWERARNTSDPNGGSLFLFAANRGERFVFGRQNVHGGTVNVLFMVVRLTNLCGRIHFLDVQRGP